MATVTATPTVTDFLGEENCRLLTWTPLIAANAIGSAERMGGRADRCVHVFGTFNGATVILQGSHDNSTWATLTDPLGNALSFTAAGMKQVAELTKYVRPSMSGGGGSESISVLLFVRG